MKENYDRILTVSRSLIADPVCGPVATGMGLRLHVLDSRNERTHAELNRTLKGALPGLA